MPDRPRNVLIIQTDQQRPDTIGAYGTTRRGPQVRTPHLDRLAATGALFEQAYCAQPVCSPARASILTGLYPHTNEMVVNCGTRPNAVPLSAAAPTLAELLRPAGYACGHIGKWHLGNENGLVPPGRRGFEDHWVSAHDTYVRDHAAEGYSDYHQWLVAQGLTPPDPSRNGTIFGPMTTARLPKAFGKPAFIAQETMRFLEAHDDRPFVLVASFKEPHPPCFGPLDDMYDPDDFALPASWYREPESTVPLRFRLRRHPAAAPLAEREQLDPEDERSWRAYMARYWGLCALVDEYAGQILDGLDALGLAERTVVVYTTDHGDMMGEHRMLNKGLPYEGAARVPLLIRVPPDSSSGRPFTPRRLATPVSQVDLVPTLLSLLDRPLPRHLQGSSLVPLLEHGDRAPDEAEVIVEWNGTFKGIEEVVDRGLVAGVDASDSRMTAIGVRTIRRGRWKLNVNESGEHELYDLHDDPAELHNALFDPGCGPIVRALDQRLRTWQRATGDPMALPAIDVPGR